MNLITIESKEFLAIFFWDYPSYYLLYLHMTFKDKDYIISLKEI